MSASVKVAALATFTAPLAAFPILNCAFIGVAPAMSNVAIHTL